MIATGGVAWPRLCERAGRASNPQSLISMDPVATLTPSFAKEIFHRADTMSGR
jgi:hypothetical protein